MHKCVCQTVRNISQNPENFYQRCENFNYAMAGISFISSLVSKHFQIDSFIEKNQACLLVGNTDVIKMVKTRLDYRDRGLLLWKKSYVTEINEENKEKYQQRIIEKANVHLMICTSVKSDLSTTSFCMPKTATNEPSDIKRKSIVIVKTKKDTEDDVRKCIVSIRKNPEIKKLSPNQEFVVSGEVKIELKDILKLH